MSLSSATFRVILERLFSSQTVYAPWVLEVLLQMGDQNLENTGTCNCSSECMYMIVQLCVLKISRKWNFYYWRNECLEIQYSSEVECIIQCSQLPFFCTVSCFKMPPPKHRINNCKSQQLKGAMAAVSMKRWNDFSWFHQYFVKYVCESFKMWTANSIHFFFWMM